MWDKDKVDVTKQPDGVYDRYQHGSAFVYLRVNQPISKKKVRSDMNDNEQLEFDFGQVCKCNENTSYDNLCPVCLEECLEFMEAQTDYNDFEEYA